jgi:hypothetical protein
MKHHISVTVIFVALLVAAVAAASNEFISIWKSPTAGPLNFVGRKVGAVVIVDDFSLQMSAEEARPGNHCARPHRRAKVPSRRASRRQKEAHGAAKGLVRAGRAADQVIMRLVVHAPQKGTCSASSGPAVTTRAPGTYRLRLGCRSRYAGGKGRIQTTITVETMYDLTDGKPIWGRQPHHRPEGCRHLHEGSAKKDIVKQLRKPD